VAYIPRNGKVVGLSKLARAVEAVARRPQLQERMTSTVADSIVESLEPYGVVVVVEAEHLCMTMRGVKKPGAKTVTSAVRGIFETDAAARAEVFSLIKGS
jgi:GTP cyclohydrolase I